MRSRCLLAGAGASRRHHHTVDGAGGGDGFAVSTGYGARSDRHLRGGQGRSENDGGG